MKCSYHPIHTAFVQCSACGRPLCPSCDHRIKGFPHCQACIVRGVELLWSAGRQGQTASDASRAPRHRSPVAAVLFGLIPGLGAVYNRQPVKAFVHFIVICGLFELGDLSGLGLFGLGGAVFYFYSMIDAYRTARAVAGGADAAKEDERLRRWLRENGTTWAFVLIGLGVMFLLTDVLRVLSLPFGVREVWPLALIGTGAALVWRRGRAAREDEAAEDFSTDFHLVTPSLFTPPAGRLTGGIDPSEPDVSSLPNRSERKGV